MYTVIKEFSFEYAHRLMTHSGLCKNIHGHSAKVKVEIASDELDENGMVTDFNDLKFIQTFLNREYDHALILNNADPIYNQLISLDLFNDMKLKRIEGEPTSENFARLIAQYIVDNLPNSNSTKYISLDVEFWETAKNSATYSMHIGDVDPI